MARWIQVVALCAVCAAAAATAAVVGDLPAEGNARFLAAFEIVVFGSEVPGRESGSVAKWTRRIDYKLGGLPDAVEKFRPVVREHIEAIAPFTGLEYGEVAADAPDEALIIWFSTTERMARDGRMLAARPEDVAGMQDANCFFLTYARPGGEFVRARIVVNSDHSDDQIRHCLLEELTQSMGLPNDDPRLVPSIFNDAMKLHELSLMDKVLLRLVYDPRMAPGTPRADAMALAAGILAELNPGG